MWDLDIVFSALLKPSIVSLFNSAVVLVPSLVLSTLHSAFVLPTVRQNSLYKVHLSNVKLLHFQP